MERKRRCQLVVWLIIMALPLSMVTVGIKYRHMCDIHAPLYLILMGTILFIIGTLAPLLSLCTDQVFNTVEETVKNLLMSNWKRLNRNSCIVFLSGAFLLAASFAFPCTMLWGSIIVFGNYDKWTCYNASKIISNVNGTFDTYLSEVTVNNTLTNKNQEFENKNGKIFCEYTPFMFAFVILLLKWVIFLLPLFCCGSCMAYAGYSMRKTAKKGNPPQDDPQKPFDNNCDTLLSL